MKVQINLGQIAQIAGGLKTYKKLIVSSVGQMFQGRLEAEEAVRTKNLIIDDDNEKIGLLDMTEADVALDKLRIYGKDPAAFEKLFDKALIPVEKKSNVKTDKVEMPKQVSEEDAAAIAKALKGEPASGKFRSNRKRR